METAYLSLGSNRGNRRSLLQQATDLIRQRVGSVVCCSPLYETAPWGLFEEGEGLPFLNLALAVETDLEPHALLTVLKEIEKDMGRDQQPAFSTSHKPGVVTRRARGVCHDMASRIYRSRPIDIDIILYGLTILDTPELTLPHPRMHLRRFVLQPLCDIAPDRQHPLLKKSIKHLLETCPDTSMPSCCSSFPWSCTPSTPSAAL